MMIFQVSQGFSSHNSITDISDMFNVLNNICKDTSFTIDGENSKKMDFPDKKLTVNNGSLQYSIYRKSMINDSIIANSICHPPKISSNFVCDE